jgi:uncharacterized membrane protein YgcG
MDAAKQIIQSFYDTPGWFLRATAPVCAVVFFQLWLSGVVDFTTMVVYSPLIAIPVINITLLLLLLCGWLFLAFFNALGSVKQATIWITRQHNPLPRILYFVNVYVGCAVLVLLLSVGLYELGFEEFYRLVLAPLVEAYVHFKRYFSMFGFFLLAASLAIIAWLWKTQTFTWLWGNFGALGQRKQLVLFIWVLASMVCFVFWPVKAITLGLSWSSAMTILSQIPRRSWNVSIGFLFQPPRGTLMVVVLVLIVMGILLRWFLLWIRRPVPKSIPLGPPIPQVVPDLVNQLYDTAYNVDTCKVDSGNVTLRRPARPNPAPPPKAPSPSSLPGPGVRPPTLTPGGFPPGGAGGGTKESGGGKDRTGGGVTGEAQGVSCGGPNGGIGGAGGSDPNETEDIPMPDAPPLQHDSSPQRLRSTYTFPPPEPLAPIPKINPRDPPPPAGLSRFWDIPRPRGRGSNAPFSVPAAVSVAVPPPPPVPAPAANEDGSGTEEANEGDDGRGPKLFANGAIRAADCVESVATRGGSQREDTAVASWEVDVLGLGD